MEIEKYNKAMDIIIDQSGGNFLMLHTAHTRYLDGDAYTALALAYILNELRLKHKNPRSRKWLLKNNMWFLCPTKGLEEHLGMKRRGRDHAIRTLIAKKIIRKKHLAGNNTWLRINTKRLEKMKYGAAQNVQIVQTGTEVPECTDRTVQNVQSVHSECTERTVSYVNKKEINSKEGGTAVPSPSPNGGACHTKETLLDQVQREYLTQCQELRNALRNAKMNVGTATVKSWAKALTKWKEENTFDHVPSLQYYIANCTKDKLRAKKLPIIGSMKQFCNLQGWIEERRLNEINGKIKTNRSTAKSTALSPQVQTLLEKLTTYRWPKDSASQLPAILQSSWDNHKAIMKAMSLLENSTKDVHLKRFIESVTSNFAYTDQYLTNWFKRINSRVTGWDDWSGELGSYALSTKSKEFRREIYSAAERYSGNIKLGEQLLEALDGSN